MWGGEDNLHGLDCGYVCMGRGEEREERDRGRWDMRWDDGWRSEMGKDTHACTHGVDWGPGRRPTALLG